MTPNISCQLITWFHLCQYRITFEFIKVAKVSGKDGKPDSWFLFDSYKRKSGDKSPKNWFPKCRIFHLKRIKYCTKKLKNIYLCNILPIYSEIISKMSDFIKN